MEILLLIFKELVMNQLVGPLESLTAALNKGRNCLAGNHEYQHQTLWNWPTLLRYHAMNKCVAWTDGRTNEISILLPYCS